MMLLSLKGYAAAMCVMGDYGTDCSYLNYSECKQTAEKENGECIVNPSTFYGNGPICLASVSQAVCIYYSWSDCKADAKLADGLCAPNPKHR
jgi:hypothetical protein